MTIFAPTAVTVPAVVTDPAENVTVMESAFSPLVNMTSPMEFFPLMVMVAVSSMLAEFSAATATDV